MTSATPILVTTLLAWQEQSVSPRLMLLMLIASVMTHAGCHLINDYLDSIRGLDSVQTHVAGGTLQTGHIASDDLQAITISFSLALLLALPVMVSIDWIVSVIVLFAAGAAFFYTAGPYALAYNRMDEVGVFLASGVAMVCGINYLHAGTPIGTAFALPSSIGLYAAAILHANNIRDAEVDRKHGKMTLADTLGRPGTFTNTLYWSLCRCSAPSRLCSCDPNTGRCS